MIQIQVIFIIFILFWDGRWDWVVVNKLVNIMEVNPYIECFWSLKDYHRWIIFNSISQRMWSLDQQIYNSLNSSYTYIYRLREIMIDWEGDYTLSDKLWVTWSAAAMAESQRVWERERDKRERKGKNNKIIVIIIIKFTFLFF